MKSFPLEFFSTSQTLPIGFPALEVFGGWLARWQGQDASGTIAAGLVLIVAAIWFHPRCPKLLSAPRLLAAVAVLSAVASLKIAIGCDELFLNLKHSYVLSRAGHFSYNLHEHVEGTVDFLPYALAGLLGKLGAPLVETILAITLAGNALTIVAAWKIARALVGPSRGALGVALVVGLLPAVCFVGATGFTAVLFTGWFLWAAYFLWFATPRALAGGLAFLATLTLVRTEGVALAGLSWPVIYLWEPWRRGELTRSPRASVRRAVSSGLILMAPFLASAVVRHAVFGYALPSPMAFKFTNGDLYYLYRGARQFAATLTIHDLHWLMLAAAVPIYRAWRAGELSRSVVALLGVSLLHTLLYYTGRGDWFPLVWGRYAMVLLIPATIVGWVYLVRELRERGLSAGARAVVLGAFWLAPFVVFPSRYAAHAQMSGDIRRAIPASQFWLGVNQQGYFGRFLALTTPPETVISSSEVASVMYYAERDLLDLLGAANPEVAHTRLNPVMRGDVVHRKRDPETIARHRPGVLCFWGMVWRRAPGAGPLSLEQARTEVERRYTESAYAPFSQLDIAQYRAGRLERLRELGYRWLVVTTPEASFNYLVQDSLYSAHVDALARLGITRLGTADIHYTIHPEIDAAFK